MKYLSPSLVACLAALSLVSATKADDTSPESPPLCSAPCEHTPTSRQCWGDYDVDTDYYNVFPDTGVTREYWLYAQNTTLAPDGVERLTMNFNGSIPGPLIEADWGDNVIVHVTNYMANNGTSVHWHGLRLLDANPYDGVGGVTQCPIPPGQSMTYKFRATEYGSSWYHSHYGVQYGDGLWGPIIINGPATANYDEDLGVIGLTDWYHEPAFALYDLAQAQGFPPNITTGLINGMNVYNDTGSRYEAVFEPGKKYRIRLVNTGLEAHFRFAIDNHTLTVIANNMVPIVPYTTDSVAISMGQRYDIIVEANQEPGDYWMRAIWTSSCSTNLNPDDIRGIIRYDATSQTEPTNTSPGFPETCGDEPYASLVPRLSIDTPAPPLKDMSVLQLQGSYTNIIRWPLNSSALHVNWSAPTNLLLANATDSLPTSYNAYRLPQTNEWAYWVVTDLSAAIFAPYHPMHLHGHDFWVLSQGDKPFDPAIHTLNTNNPPRRDTATLPAQGHLVLAFRTDNPGSWLFHCHVAWHASEGFSVQFIEREQDVVPGMTAEELDDLHATCAAFEQYQTDEVYAQIDSGI